MLTSPSAERFGACVRFSREAACGTGDQEDGGGIGGGMDIFGTGGREDTGAGGQEDTGAGGREDTGNGGWVDIFGTGG